MPAIYRVLRTPVYLNSGCVLNYLRGEYSTVHSRFTAWQGVRLWKELQHTCSVSSRGGQKLHHPILTPNLSRQLLMVSSADREHKAGGAYALKPNPGSNRQPRDLAL